MSTNSEAGSAALPLSLERHVNAACRRFEAAWRAGGRPRIEDYLADGPEPARPALLAELLGLELAYRSAAGEAPATEEYRVRLPGHHDLIDEAFRSLDASTLRPLSLPDRITEPEQASRRGTPDGPEAGAPAVSGYEVLGRLGRGGMGDVWRGRDYRLRRDVAIKVMKEELAGHPQLARRFLEEAQVASQLQHPAIPPVHELGAMSDGRPYIAMRLVRGRTLSDLLKQRPDPGHGHARFLAVFEQVCQAVAYAHSMGVIHRDLKPQNVMVGGFGEVQVMDWGLAKVLAEASRERERPEGGSAESVVATARTAGADDATRPGSVLGTYAYMAPEQARGEIEQLDRRCDVFGLGAMLCEVLTGQPPYMGTATELEAQAEAGHLAPARERLAACGTDPELVALAERCLSARAEERPADAGEVAAAVAAHLAGVQERLRRAELERAAAQARAAEEHKRRRVQLALAAAVLLVVAVGGGGAWWVRLERSGRQQAAARAIETALDKASVLRQQAHWAEAGLVLEQALARLDETGRADLRRPLEQAIADLDLVHRLEGIRLHRVTIVDGQFDNRTAEDDYAKALSKAGLGDEGEDAEAVAARIRDAAIRDQVVAALDDWAAVTKDSKRQAWLLEVARRADPAGRGSRFRDPEVWRDREKLRALAEDVLRDDRAKLGELSPQVLAVLGSWLGEGAEAVPLLSAAQRRYPSDFWLSLLLGSALDEAKQHEDAVRYLQVAVAVRPDAVVAHSNLGLALHHKGDVDGAIVECQAAIDLDPRYAGAHNNLGMALRAKGKLDTAIAEYRTAIALDPKLAAAHNNLGIALEDKQDLDGAIRELQEAVALEPKKALAHRNLGWAAGRAGLWDKAAAGFMASLELDPGDHWLSFLSAPALLQTGDLAGYRRVCREMLARFGRTDAADLAERTAKTCSLMAGAVGDFASVLRLADLAVEKNGSDRWIQLTKALAEYRAGRCAAAIEWLQRVAPDAGGGSLDATALAVLAMARKQQGQAEEAHAALEQARAILAHKLPKPDRGQPFGDDWHNWLRSHILYREAESLLAIEEEDTHPKPTKGP
jgi:serine/threonine-protein kinase